MLPRTLLHNPVALFQIPDFYHLHGYTAPFLKHFLENII